MELEALQLPEADLQVLNLESPVSPPNQMVSRQRRGLTCREKSRACWVGAPAEPSAAVTGHCSGPWQAAASVRPSSMP